MLYYIAALATSANNTERLGVLRCRTVGIKQCIRSLIKRKSGVVGHAAVNGYVGAVAGDPFYRTNGIKRHSRVGYNGSARLEIDLWRRNSAEAAAAAHLIGDRVHYSADIRVFRIGGVRNEKSAAEVKHR